MRKINLVYRLLLSIGLLVILFISFSLIRNVLISRKIDTQVSDSLKPKMCTDDFGVSNFKKITSNKVLPIKKWGIQIEYPKGSVLQGLEFSRKSDIEYINIENLNGFSFIVPFKEQYGISINPFDFQNRKLECNNDQECALKMYESFSNNDYLPDKDLCLFSFDFEDKRYYGFRSSGRGLASSDYSMSIYKILNGSIYGIGVIVSGLGTAGKIDPNTYLNFLASFKTLD